MDRLTTEWKEQYDELSWRCFGQLKRISPSPKTAIIRPIKKKLISTRRLLKGKGESVRSAKLKVSDVWSWEIYLKISYFL